MCKQTCSACSNCGHINPQLLVPPVKDACVKYEFKAKPPLRVTQKKLGNTITVTYELINLRPPTAMLTVEPAAIEVGRVVEAIFTASADPGSEVIQKRELTPASYTPTQDDFTFSVAGVSSNIAGEIARHTYQVTDTENQKASATAAVIARHRYLIIYSVNKNLTAAELQLALDNRAGEIGASIKDTFGNIRPYPVPAGPVKHYIHWVYPHGDAGIGQPVADTGEPVPVDVTGAQLVVTNPYGLEITYTTTRTSYAFGEFIFNFQF